MRKLADRIEDIGQVGVAIAATSWRANGNEHGFGTVDPFGKIGRKAQATAPNIARADHCNSHVLLHDARTGAARVLKRHFRSLPVKPFRRTCRADLASSQ
jgi:hypothetical protein